MDDKGVNRKAWKTSSAVENGETKRAPAWAAVGLLRAVARCIYAAMMRVGVYGVVWEK